MNFKTTVVLLVLLVVALGALFFTRDGGGEEGQIIEENRQRLFDLAANDVNKVVIAAADGKAIALERAGAKWRMTQPVNAPAESFEVDSLVRALTELESRGQVTSAGADAEATGLAQPRYIVELSTSAGRSYTLNVGEKPAVGDILYVARQGEDETQVVSADLLEQLEKPAADFRDKKLVDVSTGDVRQITLEKPDGRIVIARSGTGDWRITEPTTMPAEKSEVDDILFGLTGLRAVEYVSENLSDAAQYQLDNPRLRATLSTTQPVTHRFVATAPSTAPATQDAAPLVINFGRYEDVLKNNVFVSTSQSPAIATVSANIIETISKKPIELRDRRAMDIDPAQVSSIAITSDLAATTQPTTRAASKAEMVIRRRQEAATTAPATTQAATQAASEWEVVVDGAPRPADDAKVHALLGQLDPLRAQKYLESAPTTQPAATYVIRLTTIAPGGAEASHELKLVDPGDTKPLIATYNDLTFEADRSLVSRLSGDFLQGSASSPPSPPGDLANDPDAAPFPIGP